MVNWSGGYVTEVTYPYSYRSYMNPVRISALLTLAGYEVPTGSVVCELGFGQGVAIDIHACTQPDSVYMGTDFSPAQTRFAQDLHQQTGADVLLSDYQAQSVQSLHDRAKARPQDSFATTLDTIKALWAANVIAPAQTEAQI
jgi:hypothetical protein